MSESERAGGCPEAHAERLEPLAILRVQEAEPHLAAVGAAIPDRQAAAAGVADLVDAEAEGAPIAAEHLERASGLLGQIHALMKPRARAGRECGYIAPP